MSCLTVVYEPSPFIVAHQDSEKADDMIGTLVAILLWAFTARNPSSQRMPSRCGWSARFQFR